MFQAAWRVLRNPSDAEDVTQEVFLRVLDGRLDLAQADSPAAVLRWWTVRMALARRRTENTRQEHEGRTMSDRSAHTESPDDLAEQAEETHVVQRALDRLDRNEQELLLLRYQEGLALTEIGTALGISESTVVRRIRQALERLRRPLRECGYAGSIPLLLDEDGAGLAETLASPAPEAPADLVEGIRRAGAPDRRPEAGIDAVGRTTSTEVVSRLGLGALLLGGAAAVFLLSRPDEPARTQRDDPSGQGSVATAPTEAERVASSPSSLSDASRVEQARVGTTPQPAGASPAGAVVLHGRLVRPDGSAIEGADLTLRGWAASATRVRTFGAPSTWDDVVERSTGDGSFRLVFEAPRAFQFALEAEAEGTGGASWQWLELLPGSSLDLGAIELARAAELVVGVFDEEGGRVPLDRALVATQELPAALRSPAPDGGRHGVTRRAFGVDEDGRFQLSPLPPGGVGVRAHLEDGRILESPGLTLEPGERRTFDFRVDGAEDERVFVRCSNRMLTLVGHDELTLLAYGASGPPVQAEHAEGLVGAYVFEGLSVGPYRIELDDARFEPWSVNGVMPGDSVRAELRGNSSIRLRVLKETGSEDAWRDAGLAVDVDALGALAPPGPLALLGFDDRFPADGILDDLVGGDWALRVRSPNLGDVRVEVPALRPGERRTVDVVFSRRLGVAGTVTNAEGRPVPSLDLVLFPAAQPAEHPARVRLHQVRLLAHQGKTGEHPLVTTDASGRYRFENVEPGTYVIDTSWRRNLRTTTAPIEVEVGPGPDVEVDVVLPAAARVHGRLIGFPTNDTTGVRVAIQRSPWPQDIFFVMARSSDLSVYSDAVPAEDGSFLVEDLPPGTCQVLLAFPDVEHRGGGRSMGRRIHLGELVLEPGDNEGIEFDVGGLLAD